MMGLLMINAWCIWTHYNTAQDNMVWHTVQQSQMQDLDQTMSETSQLLEPMASKNWAKPFKFAHEQMKLW